MDIKSLVELIKKDKKDREITPRQLFNSLDYERRTPGNCYWVDQYLEKNNLEVEPHYNEVWIDNKIWLKHKAVATSNVQINPIKKLAVLEAATQTPQVVKRDDKLNVATTIMQLHNYSQLPVISNSMRDLCGYISWETIGTAITNGVKSDLVKDYINPIVKTLSLETPILKAVHTVHKHEFVVVVDKSKEIKGIVTTTDISSQFLTITEPFLLLEQIENHIRLLLTDKFLLEDIHNVIGKETDGLKINSIDDLTFGQYLRLIENSTNWNKLEINCDKTMFIKHLHEVRKVRNDIMHFEPAGITDEQYCLLRKVSDYINKIVTHKQALSS